MKEEGLTSKVRIKIYRSYSGQIGKAAPNVIGRDFKADKPNRKWTTDVTEFSLFGRKLYLSPILDMFNGEIVSYDISTTPTLSHVMNMLDKAFAKVKDTEGLIFHSDQGWQYHHAYYQKALKNHGIIQSMSRKGNCLDNSVLQQQENQAKTKRNESGRIPNSFQINRLITCPTFWVQINFKWLLVFFVCIRRKNSSDVIVSNRMRL